MMYCKKPNYTNNCFTPKEIQILNTMRRLWFEHVMWTRSFIVSTAFSLDDLEPVTKRLLRNPTDFASILTPFYGQQAAKAFEKLFSDHLLIAAQIVNAAKAGNTEAVGEQRDKWYANATDIATFLAQINPYWIKAKWQKMLFDHLKMTENEAVQMLSGKYNDSIDQYDAIQAEALEMADEMTNGIIKQFRI